MSSSVDTIRLLQQEVEHWKNIAEQHRIKLESTQEEFGEFQSESKSLEKELEAQLEQLERRNRDLLVGNQKLTMDHESTRAKLHVLQVESHQQIDRLETELSKVKGERDEMQRYIRDLEQTNDDLERAKRAAVVSLEDFERRLNEAIERNAFLENELDEKDDLQAYVQRLKEETRDLKQDLKVKDRLGPGVALAEGRDRAPGLRPAAPSLSGHPHVANGSLVKSNDVLAEKTVNSTRKASCSAATERSVDPAASSTLTAPFAASTRIAALTIVSDLIRKVGALEVKLSNSKRFSTDSSYPLTPAAGPLNPSLISNKPSANAKDRPS